MGIRVLGSLEVDTDEALRPRDRVLLQALVIRRGRPMSPEHLAEALWATDPPASWRKQVQICVGRLRKALGAKSVVTTSAGYCLAVAADEIDAARFEAEVDRARALVAAGDHDRAATGLRRALDLWHGEPFETLDGWAPAVAEATRLNELRRTAEEEWLEARLAVGDHRDVAGCAEVMVSDEPLRELRWALLALARYRAGRQADALRALQDARRMLADQLGISPGPDLIELERAILEQDDGLRAPAAHRTFSDACPYRGLAAYGAEDADRFYGRDADVAACVTKLRSTSLLAVTGPSGCGKSSLVRAGVVPALERNGWRCIVMVPGADPMRALADALATTRDSAAVVVVDQFEELVDNAVSADDARRFCHWLLERARDVAPVVVTVRADCIAGLAIDPELGRLAERGMHLVAPLTGDDLREAIEQPALGAGLRLEAGLTDLLVRECEDEPGALPLLSHALVETWRRRDGRVLTVDGYRVSGGIRGAVARSADRLHDLLEAEDRGVLRALMLRLVTPSPDGDPIRCRLATRSLLDDPARDRIVTMLVRSRLVTADEDTIEIAHEALARAWPRLRAWLDEDTTGQRILRHLATTAQGWDELGRPDAELYRGMRLQAALEWSTSALADLTHVERHFLDASAERDRVERAAFATEAARHRVQNRRLRGLLASTAVVLVVAVTAGVLAWEGREEARSQRDAADAARADARIEALVNRSLALRSTNRAEAALLAVEAYRRRPDARSHAALLGTFTAAQGFVQHVHLDESTEMLAAAPVPGREEAVVLLGDGSSVVFPFDGSPRRQLAPPTEDVGDHGLVRVSADGAVAVQLHVIHPPPAGRDCGTLDELAATNGSGCSTLSAFDVATGRRLLGPLPAPVGPGDITLSPDGALLAVAGGYDGDVVVYAVADGRMLGRLDGISRPADVSNVRDTAAVAFDQRGRLLVGSLAGPIRVVDPHTMTATATFDTPMRSSHNHLALTSDGVAVAAGDEWLVAIDVDTGAERWRAEQSGTDSWPCPFLTVAGDTDLFYCGSYFGWIEERELGTGRRTGRVLDPQLGSVGDVAITDGGDELLTFGELSSVITRWRLDGTGAAATMVAPGRVTVGGYDPTGTMLLTADIHTVSTDAEDFSVTDASTGAMVDTIDVALGRPTDFGPAWVGRNRFVARFPDGGIGVYDVGARARVGGLRLPADLNRTFLTGDGRRWYAGGDQWVQAYDATSGAPVGERLRRDGWSDWIATTRDGERMLTSVFVEGVGMSTTIRDETGAVLAGPVEGFDVTNMSGDGTVAVGSSEGAIVQLDPSTLDATASFPGARGFVQELQLDDDGRILATPSADGTVSVYDVATRVRLGDPIAVATADLPPGAAGLLTGALRPDGRAVAVNTSAGVVVWELDPGRLVAAACRLAGRNLTATEWAADLTELGSRRATCAEYPLV